MSTTVSRIKFLLLVFLPFMFACSHNKIETEKTLSKADKEYINSIVHLDKDETICKFYSEFRLKEMGNFYTNKRVVEYSIRNNNRATLRVFSAFYQDITAIDTVYDAEPTYCPYLAITKARNDTVESFRVCFEGDKKQLKEVFEGAIQLWKNAKISKIHP